VIQGFESVSGHHVRIVRQPTDSDQRRQGLVISLESRQPDPDVFLMDVVWVGQFVRSNWLEPLDTYMRRSRFSLHPFFARVVDLMDRYDKHVFALPVYVDGGLLYYRTDLLKHYGYDGPPQTWDHLLRISQHIQAEERVRNPNFHGFVWQGAQYEGLVCTFLEFTASHGGGILEGGHILLNRPPNVEALKFMQALIHRYAVSPPNTFTEMKEEEVRLVFQRGNALFERNWPYAWKLHQSESSPVKGKVGIAPLPRNEGNQPASALGGWHVGISRHSDQKEAAWDLVEYLCSYETQRQLALNLGWNPGRTDVYTDPLVLKQLPHLSRLRDVFQYAVARPNVPYYTQISEVIQRNVNSALASKSDAETALEHMQEEVAQITRIYGKN
jgi:multiple sugar transport system substrate-binding protein